MLKSFHGGEEIRQHRQRALRFINRKRAKNPALGSIARNSNLNLRQDLDFTAKSPERANPAHDENRRGGIWLAKGSGLG